MATESLFKFHNVYMRICIKAQSLKVRFESQKSLNWLFVYGRNGNWLFNL